MCDKLIFVGNIINPTLDNVKCINGYIVIENGKVCLWIKLLFLNILQTEY